MSGEKEIKGTGSYIDFTCHMCYNQQNTLIMAYKRIQKLYIREMLALKPAKPKKIKIARIEPDPVEVTEEEIELIFPETTSIAASMYTEPIVKKRSIRYLFMIIFGWMFPGTYSKS